MKLMEMEKKMNCKEKKIHLDEGDRKKYNIGNSFKRAYLIYICLFEGLINW